MWIIFTGTQIKAGNDGFCFGPRAIGTGQSGLLHSDIWAVHNNIGALGWLKNGGAGLTFENRYGLSAFNQGAFSVASSPKKWGIFGLGASRFGGDIFNQTRTHVGWAKAFGIASIGIQGQWYQLAASEFPSRHYFLINFGGLAHLTPKIHFAASISNITQSKASDFKQEKLPTIASVGLAFFPNPKVKLLAEIQKDLDQKAVVKVGLEYEFVEKFWIRTGFTTQTNQATGGFGMEWRNLVFNYAVARHPVLGWTNAFSINYIFQKLETEVKPNHGKK